MKQNNGEHEVLNNFVHCIYISIGICIWVTMKDNNGEHEVLNNYVHCININRHMSIGNNER